MRERERERENTNRAQSGCLTGKSLAAVSNIVIRYSYTTVLKKVKGFWREMVKITTEGSAIAAGDFGYYTFYGDLRENYLGDGGGAGTYTRSSGGNTWTKTAAGS